MSLMTYFATSMTDEGRSNDRILESDYVLQAYINKKFAQFEPMLMSTKWFDYRFMTPLEATKVYADIYGQVYQRLYKSEIDRNKAEYIRVLSWERINEGLKTDATKWKRILTGCWRGRQFADGIGMPYEHFIELAIGFRLRRWQQRYMPQPEHLYHEIVIEKTAARWEELIPSRLWTSDHPAYMVQNYANLDVQNEYHEWMFRQAMLRSNVHEALARIIHMDMLPYEKVMSRYPDDWDRQRINDYLAHSV